MTTIVIVTAHLSPVERIPNKPTKILHFFDADPDPTFYFHAHPEPAPH